jgi:hypothetical protein
LCFWILSFLPPLPPMHMCGGEDGCNCHRKFMSVAAMREWKSKLARAKVENSHSCLSVILMCYAAMLRKDCAAGKALKQASVCS